MAALLGLGQVVEIRALHATTARDRREGVESGYFDDASKAAAAVVGLRSARGVYWTINPVAPALLARASNRLRRAGSGDTTADHDVVRRRWVPVDLDPVRPAGISSTDAEHAAALELARRISEDLANEGWPLPVFIDSGNGALLLYRCDLPGADEGQVAAVLAGLAARFDGDGVKVDTSVHNPARICRLPGTLNCKGDCTPERPHRMAQLVSAPAELEVVSVDQLRGVATLPKPPAAATRQKIHLHAHRPNGEQLDLGGWLARNGIAASGPKPWSGGGGGQVYELAQCPFSEAHSDGAWAAVMGSGALAAGCQHMSCAGWGWAELRAKYEGPRRAAVGGRQPEPNRHNRQPLNEVDVLEVCAARTAAMARVREAIDAAKEARDAAPVWAAVGDLAELDQAAYGSIKSELVAWKTGAKVALSPRDLDRAVRDHRRWRANERRAALAAVPGQLPRIYVNGRALRDISAEAITHLALGDQPPTVFLRSGVLARTRTDEKGRVSIDAANESFLRGRLDRTAEYLLRGDDADKPVPPPIDVVRDVMALDLDAELARLGLTPLPRLVGVIESPGPRPDGSLILAPGYDPATGLYYAPGPGLGDVRVPDAPTLADVAAARDLIDEVLWDFPFDVQASRANAFAAVLTIVVRPMICGPVPLAIIDKPQPGTGGSLLVEVIALFGTGQPAAMSGAPTTEDEWRKAITTHVRDGVPLIVWDNVEVTLESDSLARFLTARVWADRLLSTNTSIRYEVRAVQLATGNNVALGRQLTRRVYRVRLNAKVARPEQRVGFRHPDLLRWVGENRGRIVAAVLVLCRAWVVAGRPPGDAPMLGSFEDWSAVVGGILTFAGIEGFGRDRASAEESPDDESAEWDAFFTAVGRRFGRDAWTAGQLVKEIGESPEVRDALPIALSSYVRQVPGQFGTTWLAHPRLPLLLGKAISQKNETRYASGVYVRKAGKEGHAKVALWRVQNDNPLAGDAGDAGIDLAPTRAQETFRRAATAEIPGPPGEGPEPSPQPPQPPQNGRPRKLVAEGLSPAARNATEIW